MGWERPGAGFTVISQPLGQASAAGCVEWRDDAPPRRRGARAAPHDPLPQRVAASTVALLLAGLRCLGGGGPATGRGHVGGHPDRHRTGCGSVDTGSLCDASVVHDIAVTYDQAAVAAMIAPIGDRREGVDRGDRHHRRETFERVGIRLKGNSSLRWGVGRRGGRGSVTDDAESLPWLVRLDEFVDGQVDRRAAASSSCAPTTRRPRSTRRSRSTCSAEAGLASEHAVALSFSVNGADAGLRLVVQNPDEEWEAENFDTDGLLYKSEAEGDWS